MELGEILNKIIPAQRLVFTAKAKPRTYCTYQRIIDTAALSADDETKASRITYRVTLFSKDNYEKTLQSIREALQAAGYYINSVDGEDYETDTGYYMCPLTIQQLTQ